MNVTYYIWHTTEPYFLMLLSVKQNIRLIQLKNCRTFFGLSTQFFLLLYNDENHGFEGYTTCTYKNTECKCTTFLLHVWNKYNSLSIVISNLIDKQHAHNYILTIALPTFCPLKRPINAGTVFSNPSVTDSLYFIFPWKKSTIYRDLNKWYDY